MKTRLNQLLLLAGAAGFSTVATLSAQDPNHRWTFNGDTLDTGNPGGSNAAIEDPDTNPGTGGGSTQGANSVTLNGGGSNDSDFINLGPGLLSGAPGEVTIELWATRVANQNWGRIFDFGNRNGNNGEDYILMSWTVGGDGNNDRVEWREVTPDIGGNRLVDGTNSPYLDGTEYHIAMNIRPGAGAGGQTVVEWRSAPSGDSDLGAVQGSFVTPNTLASLNDVNGWLGRSQWAGDNTANADYNEARIFYRKVSAEELESYHDLGPDVVVHPDGDGDGLPAWFENAYGLDDADDGTGMGDPANGLNGDKDTDGFDNAAELAACTNPNDAAFTPDDTDGDGLADAWELANFGNIVDQDGNGDPDGDQGTNEQEETAGSNPNDANSVPDVDGDGINDGVEVAIWGNLSTANATSDNDGDTYSDLEEINAGTPPDNADFSPVKAELRHRWSFNGDLLDTAGSSNATIVDLGDSGTTGGGGGHLLGPDEVRLFGGPQANADHVLLGNNLVGGIEHDLTIELWATQHSAQNWSRMYSFGSNTSEFIFASWTRGTNLAEAQVEFKDGPNWFIVSSEAPAVYPLGVEHHVVVHYDNNGAGGTQMTLYKNPSGNPALGPANGTVLVGTTLKDLVDNNDWLGRSQFPDATSDASYNEVRIWNGLVHPKALEQLHDQGANDAVIVDSDGDCLPDFWEIANGLDHLDPNGLSGAFGDPDNDSVINRDEYANCTPPTDGADSDLDGLADAWEIDNFGNLLQDGSGDPDGDLATNEEEETGGTDPNDKNSFPDGDGDSLPDGYEIAIWGNTTTADGTSDNDGDTYSDLEEFLAGTPPDNGNFSPNKPELIHRWSFNGDALDSVGGSDAQVLDPDSNPATGPSDFTTNPGEVRLFGGPQPQADYVELGNNLLAGSPHDMTIELWATQHGNANWTRMLSFGSGTGEVLLHAWTRGTNLATSRVEWRNPGQFVLDLNEAPAVYPLGVEHHVAIHLDNDGAGGTNVSLYKNGSGEADLGPADGTNFAPFTLSTFTDAVDWLGRSQFVNDATANASYNEVRIYKGIVHSKVLEQLHDQGPDDALLLDTDADCLPDFWELANGLSETDDTGANGAFGDPDGDGIINRDEYALCTNPNNNDSDGDGILDNVELTLGTDPANPDTDGDGLPDLLDRAYGFDPLVAGPNGPLVFDGANLVSAGPPLTEVQNIANGVEFCVLYSRPDDYAAQGLTYLVQFSHDLLNWFSEAGPEQVVATAPGLEGVKHTYPFQLSSGRKARFWRIVVTLN